MTLRIISYGGGVQSSALIVLAVQGRLDETMGGPVDAALFSNVGDDSEHPKTLEYVREVMTPWAAEHGLPVHELQRVPQRGVDKGRPVTLHQILTRDGSRSIPIPMRMPDTGAPGTRSCTADFKIRVVSRWLKEHGATEDDPASVAIGISTDEWHRANSRKGTEPVERMVYPLLDLGLSRNDCMNVIRDAGLPVPPKSSCYFCPFHSPAYWSEMRRDEPDLFAKAQQLEDLLNERRDMLGRDRIYLTRFGQRLEEVIPEAQDALFDADSFAMDNGGECDEGYCFI